VPPPPGAPSESLLRTEALTLTYPGGTTALRELAMDVPRGSVGLVGANGAGKTTLFRLMLGQLHPTAGRLEVVPEAAVVVEDAVAGVEAGRRGSFGLVIGVDRVGRGDALRAAGAHTVVPDLDEVAVG